MMPHVITQKLNAQMNLEFHASHLYISLSNWCMGRNQAGMAVFLRIQAQKCVNQMMRVFDYIKASGTWPVINAVNMADNTIISVEEALIQLLENQALRICALECLAEEATLNTDNTTLDLVQHIRTEIQNNNEELKNILAIQYSAPASLAC
ncbi:ferritin-like domain-containing protein [Phytobacter sp. RSE-02]|uniref:ferritin-like domain-containing protein n=1 Tax=Phytobacter sp. RSE-02 TaxID=3229229 RepID=UPI00339D5028